MKNVAVYLRPIWWSSVKSKSDQPKLEQIRTKTTNGPRSPIESDKAAIGNMTPKAIA